MPSHRGPDGPALRLRVGRESLRISSQHQQLDTFFEMISEAVERGSLQSARASFVRFQDALDAHIGMEDRVFFPALHGLQPAFEGELTALVGEHEEIRRELERLRDLLAEGAIETFAHSFGNFGDQLAAHEAREEALLTGLATHRRHQLS